MNFDNVDDILNSFAKKVISDAKKNLVDDGKSLGDLYNTLNYTLDDEQDQFLIDFLMEDYGLFVDKGVKGKTSTYPETSAALSKFQYGSGTGKKGGLTKGINGWLRKKRFQWKDEKGKFMSYDTMSFIIARSIYNKGLKANLFFTKPFEAGLKTLPNKLSNAFRLDIEDAIIFGNKI
jgi:hypothetical protein